MKLIIQKLIAGKKNILKFTKNGRNPFLSSLKDTNSYSFLLSRLYSIIIYIVITRILYAYNVTSFIVVTSFCLCDFSRSPIGLLHDFIPVIPFTSKYHLSYSSKVEKHYTLFRINSYLHETYRKRNDTRLYSQKIHFQDIFLF